MGKIITNIIEDNFFKKLASTYKLSILLGMDSFAYMVSGPQQEVLLLKAIELDHSLQPEGQGVTQLFNYLTETESHLFYPYGKYTISYSATQSTLIPRRLYNKNEESTYLKQLSDLDTQAMMVRTDELSAIDARNVYAISKALHNKLTQHFPGFRLQHSTTVLNRGIDEWSLKDQTPRLYVNVLGHDLQILVYTNNQLTFANTFQYQSAKDFIYFTLLVLDQLDCSPKHTSVFISGPVLQDSEIYQLLFRYITNLAFLQPPAYLYQNGKTRSLEPHFHFDLFSLAHFF